MDDAWGLFLPAAMRISTPCHGTQRGRNIAGCCPNGAERRRCHRYFCVNQGTIFPAQTETCVQNWSLISMKTLSLIIAAFFFVFGAVVSNGAVVTRISDETGVPVDTLQAERASTGLGYGELENAHLLANAAGQSFDDIVAMHQAGEGWGKIAHDNGLNLGRIVSNAHRSD